MVPPIGSKIRVNGNESKWFKGAEGVVVAHYDQRNFDPYPVCEVKLTKIAPYAVKHGRGNNYNVVGGRVSFYTNAMDIMDEVTVEELVSSYEVD